MVISSLSELWQELAGKSASLRFRRNDSTAAVDSDFHSKLSEWRKRTEKLPDAHLLRRVLAPAPSRENSAEWITSRLCLIDALDELGELTHPASALEEIAVSLSHTKDASLAVCAHLPGGRVGVDLEPASRPVSENAAKRIMRPSEMNLALSPLEIWVIKEACFKADPANAATIIADYEISLPETSILRKPPGTRCRFRRGRHANGDAAWIFAFAVSEER